MNDSEAKIFESMVGELLRLSGFEVKNEIILGHKKVDLYIEERRLGSMRRTAVECKNYEQALGQAQVTEIYANYRPLYESNLIGEVLLVTRKGLTPSANSMVMNTRELSHLTFDQLQNSVMDFSPYLSGLVQQFDDQGLSKYYIDPVSQDGNQLEEMTLKWINGSDERPIAVLASYGMGKTTFARRMSYVLATDAIHESRNRIPILIKLGDISSEQSLEGLLGKAFTAAAIVRNYTFSTFVRLNQLGRFVILLDGFDEMKHTLSWEGFRYNFAQLNRLVVSRSRVILLGRPTAFLNDEEHKHALHGIRLISDQEFKDPDWPDYKEIFIAPFTRDQARNFLQKYLEYKIEITDSDTERRRLEQVKDYQIDHISSKQLSDITRRPVQLKMLAEILPQWKGDVSNLTVTLLYSLFIDLIIEREQEKLSRQHFTTKDRRRFARELAIWLWKTKKEMSITADDVPLSVLQSFVKASDDLESVRRDLVSACFLERKLGESLYFPHRSFQEFLVAEAVVDGLAHGKMLLSNADKLLTEEVAAFLEGLVNVKVFQEWRTSLNNHRGTLSWKFVKIFLSEDWYIDYLLTQVKENQGPWYRLLLVVASKTRPFDYTTLKNLTATLIDAIGLPRSTPKSLLDEKDEEELVLSSLFAHFCMTVLLTSQGVAVDQSLLRLLQIGTMVEVELDTKGKTAKVFVPNKLIKYYVSKIIVNKKHHQLDLRGTYPFLARTLKEYCMVSDWIVGTTLRTQDVDLPQLLDVSDEVLNKVADYQAYDPFAGIKRLSGGKQKTLR